MITLVGNAFSPFARKVRMVLEHKALAFETVDGLAPMEHARLAALNPRLEVPVLLDDTIVVVNSAHIVAYLEHRYPQAPIYPADPRARVATLAWERLADTLFDAITHDASNGGFGFPAGTMPPGLLDAARADLASVYDDLERDLDGREFLCGDVSLADYALFPHMTAVRLLDISFDAETHPRVLAWYQRLRRHPICRADLERTQAFLVAAGVGLTRPSRIVWRGDRIEWMLAHGYHEWFVEEIRANRVAWPRR